ncbi:MAG: Flagellar biosynthesis protein FlhA [Acidobacteria bacterium ADurb.Bin340]|nr:MAG: Flagellar biosynthesis protein FlhA [Acidobacteria bacterium ADurb.Bin340]
MLTFLDRLLPLMGKLAKRVDLAAPVFVIVVLVVMILPMPAWALDILITFNITISLLILMVGMYVPRPQEFNAYPSILLMVTIYRLAINVATTRRILLFGGEQGVEAAGHMVRSFGQFVVGGSYVIGLVVFLILLAIQFIVINHGAGRIAEVTARFTLDAMPGKQMAIDADLNAGYIDENEARKRRKDLSEEANFYGAMDGAVKFTQRDAIASLLILAVNIVAGIIIGILRYDMPVLTAMETFTLLTVGDGLVTAIPSLLISVGGAILTTRSGSQSLNLGTEVMSQLGMDWRPLAIAAGVLFLFGAVPGLPLVPFWFLGLLFGVVAYAAWKQKGTKQVEATLEEAREKLKPAAEPERVESLLKIDPLGLEVGYGLIPLLDAGQGGTVLERIKGLRRQMAQELGIVVPPIRIRDNLQLPANTYRVLLRGEEIARGDLVPGLFLAMNPGTATEEIQGQPTTEPAFGLPAYWIPDAQRDRAQLLGYTVVDGPTVLTTHLSELVKQQAPELLGRPEVQQLLDTLKEQSPRLVEELVPSVVPVGSLQRVLQNLLRERVSIRDLGRILEATAEAATLTRDPVLLTEYVRQHLGRTLTAPHLSEQNELGVLVLDPTLEQTLQGGIESSERGSFLALAPDRLQELLTRIATGIAQLLPGAQPVLLTNPMVRPHLRRLLERSLPHLVVLSHSEIPSDVRVVNLGTVA